MRARIWSDNHERTPPIETRRNISSTGSPRTGCLAVICAFIVQSVRENDCANFEDKHSMVSISAFHVERFSRSNWDLVGFFCRVTESRNLCRFGLKSNFNNNFNGNNNFLNAQFEVERAGSQ